MNNESTLIIIPFSAGWDSTLTALQVLRMRRKIINGVYAESEGNPLFSENLVIRLTFVKSGNFPQTRFAQQRVRAIYDALRAEFMRDDNRCELELIEHDLTFGNREYTTICQRWHGLTAMTLVSNAIMGAIDYSYNNILVYTGYHANDDDALQVMQEFENAVTAMVKLVTIDAISNKHFEIIHPLKAFTKADIIVRLCDILNNDLSRSVAEVVERNILTCTNQWIARSEKNYLTCYESQANHIEMHDMCNSCRSILLAIEELHDFGRLEEYTRQIQLIMSNHNEFVQLNLIQRHFEHLMKQDCED